MLPLLELIPKNLISWCVGQLAYWRLPGALGRFTVRAFASFYSIDLTEVERPIECFKSIGDLFSRELKPGARPIGTGVVSPADGRITEFGRIESDRLIQIKGIDYTLSALLGGAPIAESFRDGFFVTIYLAPPDYHHVHFPVSGAITSMIYCPGTLWPVNRWSVRRIPGLFCINERVITVIDSGVGRVATILVGATNVGSITLTFDDLITNSRPWRHPTEPSLFNYRDGYPAQGGGRLGSFRLGSTVILLFESGIFQPGPGLRMGPVRMGESLGVLLERAC